MFTALALIVAEPSAARSRRVASSPVAGRPARACRHLSRLEERAMKNPPQASPVKLGRQEGRILRMQLATVTSVQAGSFSVM